MYPNQHLMKHLFLAFLFIFFASNSYSQESYILNGENLILKYEVAGPLDLLIYENENNTRYFVQDRFGNIKELTNSKDLDGTYFNEFRDVLGEFTKDSSMSAQEVGFTLYSLKKFVRAYNSYNTKRYAYTDEKVNGQLRIGVFGGFTNHPLVPNPNNIITPFADIELEIFEKKELPRQSGFISIEQTFKSKDFDYYSTIIALGYRFRFINKSTFNIYANLQFATYTFSHGKVEVKNEETQEIIVYDQDNNAFRVPFIIGIGTDMKVSDTSYISLIYNELVSAFVSNNGNFPVNVSLGYKFNI